MTDVVDKKTRSRMMAGIKGKNTRPEVIVRRLLHKRGFRYRIHDNKLPGKPDMVLKKYQAVIFIHGCFWHRHECRLFKSTNIVAPDNKRKKLGKPVSSWYADTLKQGGGDLAEVSRIRSKTFEGIAKAMALQWAGLAL